MLSGSVKPTFWNTERSAREYASCVLNCGSAFDQAAFECASAYCTCASAVRTSGLCSSARASASDSVSSVTPAGVGSPTRDDAPGAAFADAPGLPCCAAATPGSCASASAAVSIHALVLIYSISSRLRGQAHDRPARPIVVAQPALARPLDL